MKRLLLLGATTVSLAIATAGAASADTDVVLSGGAHVAERESDGTTTLSVSAINLTTRDLRLRLVPTGPGCREAVGEPVVQPKTSSKVSFTTTCDSGGQPRSATVRVTYAHGTGAPATSEFPIRFTVSERSAPPWSVLWWFGAGVPLAALLVLMPYGFWVAHPQGNLVRGQSQPFAIRKAPLLRFLADAWGRISMRLPGIDKDWSLADSWSSNVTLAAGLVTTLLASTDPATAILGDGAAGPISVITVAAASSAALVATGPLWLVVFKRRWHDDPAAQLNTVAGVLMATFVVLSASFGLVITLAVLVDVAVVYVAAGAAIGLLGLYSAKSIPMTLALGMPKEEGRAVAAALTVTSSAMP